MENSLDEKLATKKKLAIVLFCLSIVLFVIFIICANKDYSYLEYTKGQINAVITLLSCMISIILFVISVMMCSSIAKKEDVDWLDVSFSENGIIDENIKFRLSNSLRKIQLIYTQDKRLFYVNIDTKTIEELIISDILNIDIECAFMEKNQRRVVALTTTYDNIKSLTEVTFKVITENKIYNINLGVSKEVIDRANQVKLILNKEMQITQV